MYVKNCSSIVKVIKQDDQYHLQVNGKPFTIKGAGVGDSALLPKLAQAGGNSFRTWSAEHADHDLASAKKHGLMVALGFDLVKELYGFDYNDVEAVKAQFERLKQTVQKYKNHPNLLCWVVANEPNLLFDENGALKDVNLKVYDAINDIIEYIHQEDPNHPVTYTFAGFFDSQIKQALLHTPNVDIISVQVYGDLDTLPSLIQASGIDKPFMITEYGAIGHWQTPQTSWGREIEEPSGMKAISMKKRIENSILSDISGRIVGDFVFLWGQKQERTPTWYGFFNKDGRATSSVDAMSEIWTGKEPEFSAPKTMDIRLNDAVAEQSVHISPNSTNVAQVEVISKTGSPSYHWVLLKEVDEKSDGGSYEQEPEQLPLTILNKDDDSFKQGIIEFIAPGHLGEYRLFSYTYDENFGVGNANFPFYVK